MKTKAVVQTGFAAAALLAVSVGCSREAKKPEAPALSTSGTRPAFAFDWKHAQSLTLVKADPASGDHWMARVERKQEKPASFYESDPWLIQTYSENSALVDRLANRGYILHLLDTFSTFHVTGVAAAKLDSDTARASYGLSPPRYSVEWTAWNEETGKTDTFRVEIGNVVDPSKTDNTESYGMILPYPSVFKVDGAAVSMLEYLKNFPSFREQTLSPVSSDDVDEIEIDRGTRKVFYAQRDGEHWTNERHKPWKKDVGAFLDRITHLRILNFPETANLPNGADAAFKHHEIERILLKNRMGQPTEFRFAVYEKHVLARVPVRSDGTFELYPNALQQKEPR